MVEPQPSKLMMWVRSPSPAPIQFGCAFAHIAQQVEHFHGKEEVTGSTPVVGSSYFFNQFNISSFSKQELKIWPRKNLNEINRM